LAIFEFKGLFMCKIYKKYWIFSILALLTLGLMGCNTSKQAKKSELLTIGLESSYPPFEFTDSKGQFIGFDVDLAKIIAEKLNKQLAIKDMEFEGMILSLKQGKIDLIMSGMNITPSRLKEISMVPYHGDRATHLSLVFWGSVPEGVQKLEDIAPHGSVGVESGSIPEAYMNRYPQIQVKLFQGALAPLMDVKYGKSTANLVEPDVAEYLKGQHPEITLINVPLPPEEQILGFGIGVKKDNQELFKQVYEIIQELRRSGELKKLENKWFKGGQPSSNKPPVAGVDAVNRGGCHG
jgi:arginine transport system substrate-binding protein